MSKAPELLPSVDFLRSVLHYDEVSGVLTWAPRCLSDFSKDKYHKAWVSRCQGKEAGSQVKKKNKIYKVIYVGGCRMYSHRVAWAIHYGKHPDDEIDHKNGNSSDNSIDNLRIVSRKENSRNVGLQANSRSGFCGVNWHVKAGRWKARVKIDGKEKYLGLFDCPEQAAAKIKEVRDSLGFYENHGAKIVITTGT